MRSLASSFRFDDDLVASAVLKAKLQLGPPPGHDEPVSEERVRDRSHRADGDEDRGPRIDSGADKQAETHYPLRRKVAQVPVSASTVGASSGASGS